MIFPNRNSNMKQTFSECHSFIRLSRNNYAPNAIFPQSRPPNSLDYQRLPLLYDYFLIRRNNLGILLLITPNTPSSIEILAHLQPIHISFAQKCSTCISLCAELWMRGCLHRLSPSFSAGANRSAGPKSPLA